MKRVVSWLHCPSMALLIVAALFLGAMPLTPEPHLVEKLRMLMNGALVKPVDVFDLFWHSWPMLWIALRLLTPGEGGACQVAGRS